MEDPLHAFVPVANFANIGAICDEGLRMKRFDHPNVLHLCGIVASGQTVWLVTPFMENGDLRTYLLRKNHVKNDRCFKFY